MPALQVNSTIASAPAPPDRRVWQSPQVKSHSRVVLTADALYLGPPTDEPRPEAVTAVEDDVEAAFAVAIELAAVHRVRLDLIDNSITVHYTTADHGASRVELVFTEQTAADGCFTCLWRRLGGGLKLLPYRRDTWSLIRGPAVLLAGLLAATLALALVSHGFEEGAEARAGGMLTHQPPTFFETLFRWLPWEVICGVGGALAAAVQMWVYRRLTEPPERLEVVRA